MKKLLQNLRFYILVFSGVLAFVFYFYITSIYSSSQLKIIRLTQYYSLTSITFLYLALLVGPVSRFISGPFIQTWLHARRAIGVSAFFFACLHAAFAFFGQLGGFEGLPFLSDYYLIGITLSFIALLILTVMSLTAFDFIVAKLKFKRWKRIHQLVYVAGVLVLIHALMLGTHFHDLSELIPLILFIAVSFLLLLHAMCWEKRLANSFLFMSRFGILSVLVFLLMFIFYFQYINPQSGSSESSPLSVHSQHLINSNETAGGSNQQGLYMPGMEGDQSKRFSVQFNHDENVLVNKETDLSFKINDAANGDPVYFFQTPFEQPFHLIIVDQNLENFEHIHPTQQQNIFSINHTFTNNGKYHLYTDFQPFGAVEQQNGFQLLVGNENNVLNSEVNPNFDKEKRIDDYIVRLEYEPLESGKLSRGEQELRFSLYDDQNNPVTNLHPYLGAFGHLVMIKKDTFEYVHAHPVMTKAVRPEERSGPEVRFVPMALYGKLTAGDYKVFAQFNPGGELITVEFWVSVK